VALVLPNWCPIAPGAIYNIDIGGGPITLLDPQVLPINQCRLPCVISYFVIVPINQPWFSQPDTLPLPPATAEEVRGGGGVGRLYTTITRVPYIYSHTPGPIITTYEFPEGNPRPGGPISFSLDLTGCSLTGSGIVPPPGPIIELDNFQYFAVRPPGPFGPFDLISPDYIVVETQGIGTNEIGVTYGGVVPVDPGQAILVLGNNLANPDWFVPGTTGGTDGFPAPTADYTQFGQIYGAYFTLPSPQWNHPA
jgi:hypothetical protein